MAKRQSHKQSRISKEMQATLELMLVTPDPAKKKKLIEHYNILDDEWI